MSSSGPKLLALIAGADRDRSREGWLTVTWQLAAVVLMAAAIGLSCNQMRTTGLPLIGAGMGQGPALALLLAGPALSLPNMIVLIGIMGFKKTFTFCSIIVVLSAGVGMGFGWLVG